MMPMQARDNERRLRVSVKESAEAVEVVIGVWRITMLVRVEQVKECRMKVGRRLSIHDDEALSRG